MSDSPAMNFPAWFFESSEPRVPVSVTRLLPQDSTDEAGGVVGKVHWRLISGALWMSREAFVELKKLTDAQPDERAIGRHHA